MDPDERPGAARVQAGRQPSGGPTRGGDPLVLRDVQERVTGARGGRVELINAGDRANQHPGAGQPDEVAPTSAGRSPR